jgi:cytochrome c-type biogenesis protein CcmE
MTPKQKKRLFFIVFLVGGLSLTVGLVLYALSQNINYFYTPTSLLDQTQPNKVIRLGGMVVENSVSRGKDLCVEFVLTDYKQQIKVRYQGILPDLFREGQGIVALGKLENNGTFQASQVLAKHDENYMPPELKGLKKS